jgi:hypothetical protein
LTNRKVVVGVAPDDREAHLCKAGLGRSLVHPFSDKDGEVSPGILLLQRQ